MKRILIFQNFIKVPLSTTLLLFVLGFAILVLQIIGIRVLGPYIGTALPVWATLIGTTLLGGIVGYYAGGVIADTRQGKKISFLLVGLAGLSIVIIPEFRSIIAELVQVTTYVKAMLISSTILFLPPATLLSMLITYVIRSCVTDLETIGQVHGDLYTVATVGSIVGVFATSYVLIPTYTVPHILYGLGALVLLSGFLNIKFAR
jgi:hypothetical protein